MKYIETKYGNDGFATWVKVLRRLTTSDFHHIKLHEKKKLMTFASECRITEDQLIEILDDLCSLEELDDFLWNECRIVWCQKLTDSIKDAYKKRKNECIERDELIEKLIDLGILKQSKLPPNASNSQKDSTRNPQSKVEKSKEEKKNIPDKETFLKYCKEIMPDKYAQYEFSLNSKYDTWLDDGWKDGNKKPIKNWKLKIKNTIPHLRPFQAKKESDGNEPYKNIRRA